MYVYNVHNRTIWPYLHEHHLDGLCNSLIYDKCLTQSDGWHLHFRPLTDSLHFLWYLRLFTILNASAGRDCSSQFSSSETDHVPGLGRTNDVTGDKDRLLSVDLPLLQSQLWREANQSPPQSDLDISVDIPGLLEASRGYDTPSGNPHPDRGSSDPGE